MNPFSISEETLELDEDEIVEKVYLCISQWYLLEEVYAEVYDEFKRSKYQLLGNARLVLHEIDVRTGVSAVLGFVERIWNGVMRDEDEFVGVINRDKEFFLRELDRANERYVEEVPAVIPVEKPEQAEAPSDFSMSLSIGEPVSQYVKIHNHMIFDCVNEELRNICSRINPPPWRKGGVDLKGANLRSIYEEIKAGIRKNCGVGAGRIPSIGMVTESGELDDLLLQKIRENGIASLLTLDVDVIEEKWTDYEIEELLTEDEVSDGILGILVNEILQIINI